MSNEQLSNEDLQDQLLDRALREVVGSETPPDLSERIMLAATGESSQQLATLAPTGGGEQEREMAKQNQEAVTKRKQYIGITIAASVLIGALILFPLSVAQRERARNTEPAEDSIRDPDIAHKSGEEDRLNLNATGKEALQSEDTSQALLDEARELIRSGKREDFAQAKELLQRLKDAKPEAVRYAAKQMDLSEKQNQSVGAPPASSTDAADFDSLIDMIVETVEADAWQDNAQGDAEIQPFPTDLKLIISQSQRVHEQSTPSDKLTMDVTPHIIIEEQEEERLGIADGGLVNESGGRPGLSAQGSFRNPTAPGQMGLQGVISDAYAVPPVDSSFPQLAAEKKRSSSTDYAADYLGQLERLRESQKRPGSGTQAAGGYGGYGEIPIGEGYNRSAGEQLVELESSLSPKRQLMKIRDPSSPPAPKPDSTYYLTDDVQYSPPGPEFKLAREAEALRRGSDAERRHAAVKPETAAVDFADAQEREKFSLSMGFGSGNQAQTEQKSKPRGGTAADGELPRFTADLDGPFRDSSFGLTQPKSGLERQKVTEWSASTPKDGYRSVTGREKKIARPTRESWGYGGERSWYFGEAGGEYGGSVPRSSAPTSSVTEPEVTRLGVQVHPVQDLVLPKQNAEGLPELSQLGESLVSDLEINSDSGLWASADPTKIARQLEIVELHEKTKQYQKIAAASNAPSSPASHAALNLLVHEAVKTKEEIRNIRRSRGLEKKNDSQQRLANLEQRYDAQVANIESKANRFGRLALLEAEIDQLQQQLHKAKGPDASGDKYAPIHENPFVKAEGEKAVSTFSIDVDTASYANVRQFLTQSGQLPPPDAVRIEELVNYFDYDYTPPTDDTPFAAHVEVAGCPWKAGHRLVRVGIKGREIDTEHRPQSNLVFLIDVSGSMNEAAKLPLLVDGMKMLTRELGENDRIAIVVYASSEGLALPSTRGDQQDVILSTLDNLRAGGSTAGGAGIQRAYEIAEKSFIPGGVNRVILATDGDFNVGTTNTDALEQMAETKAKETGVFLTVLGFGRGNLRDEMMEAISNKGNGNYHYIDNTTEARKVLVAEMAGTLVTIAKDVKIQIEFNPAEVAAYRLIGYENRMLKTEDFNNDKKDAGEIGAGHTVTAIYEVVPAGMPIDTPGVDPLKYQSSAAAQKSRNAAASDADSAGEMLTLKLRYKQPDEEVSTKLEFPIFDNEQSFVKASDDFKFASAVASFGMLLRHSQHQGHTSYSAVEEIANDGIGRDKHGYRAEFLQLVRRAKQLAGE